jgi:putative phage-type endonuclease
MGVIINNLQGTPEWHKYKESMFGASEAAAMLGISKKMTREELLFQKFTGLKKEYSSFVMNLFEKGHESEAKARAIIEDQIGEELYPAVYALGMMIASVDGITANGEIAFEHKLFNMRLHDSISKGILPPEHMPQCQQTMLVTGAKSLMFVCSSGNKESMAQLMVYPDYDYFTKIDQGWADFKRDLDNYGRRNVIGQ